MNSAAERRRTRRRPPQGGNVSQENPEGLACKTCRGDGRVWGGINGHATHRQDCKACKGTGLAPPESPEGLVDKEEA